MKKFLVYIAVVLLAMILAGVYGAVHDQISYTVGPEYFTKFKFEQFYMIDSPMPERIRASFIGFLASWWMGIPIGLLVGALGFIHESHHRMFRLTFLSLLISVAFTLLVGLCGLVYGYLQTNHINIADYDRWYIPEGVTDLRRFLCAGYMHNASYLGGVLSIPIAWTFQITMRIKAKPKGQ